MNVDDAICETYREKGIPADRLILDREELIMFCRGVESKVGASVNDDIAKRLLYLRKKGRLPRTSR